jgi:hypothetical protein
MQNIDPSPSPRAEHTMLRCLSFASLFAISLMFSPTTHAEALTCGSYVDAESGARLVVIDGERARVVREGMPPSSQRYRRDGATLRLYDIDEATIDDYTLSTDGRTVTGSEAAFRKRFVFDSPTACTTIPAAAPGTCAAEIDACIATVDLAADATLRRYCDEGMPFACMKLIDRDRQRAARPAADAGNAGDADTPPPVCREDTPTFSADACEQAVAKLLGAALAVVATSMYADAVPLPAQQLDALPALCAGSDSAKVCGKVAEELWRGNRYSEGRAALGRACDPGGDPDACRHAASLAALLDTQLKVSPSTMLPCGRYIADTGLMSELDFGDRGLITGGLGAELRARLEAGFVRIRHDKGGDFVFARIDDDRLLGLDDWNRYALYRRDGGAATCAAPVMFEEMPLVEDCPQPGKDTAQACCARGSLHGCNSVGHQLALNSAWAEAKPYYFKVCAAGVRIGCENLTQIFARGGDDTVLDDLDEICATNPRHVACDVRETTDWAALALSQTTHEFLREIEQETEEGKTTQP